MAFPFGNNNPFGNDPFLHNPFSMMGSMMSNMDRMMGSMFNDPFFSSAGFSHPGGMQQYTQGQQNLIGPRATVEEVHDDTPQTPSSAKSRPIVEEPEDDAGGHRREHDRRTSYQEPGQFRGGSTSNVAYPSSGVTYAPSNPAGGVTYAYSSSSFMSNNNGVTYQKSTRAQMGPGGVKEFYATEKDGRTGKESMTIARGLGDRARTMVRTRDASGEMSHEDVLRGIQQDEAHRFDDEWAQAAQRSLLVPGLGAARQAQPRQYALPSSTSHGHARSINQPATAHTLPQGSTGGSNHSSSRRPHGETQGYKRERFA